MVMMVIGGDDDGGDGVAIIKDGCVRRYSFGIAGIDPIRDY